MLINHYTKYLPLISLFREDISSIDEAEENRVLIDKFKIITKEQCSLRILRWLTKMVFFKVHFASCILGITLPYKTEILTSGEMSVGSKVGSKIGVALPLHEELLGLLQLDIQYLLCAGGITVPLFLSMDCSHLHQLIDSCNGFEVCCRESECHLYCARMNIVASDKEMMRSMEEEGELVEESVETVEVYSLDSSEEEIMHI